MPAPRPRTDLDRSRRHIASAVRHLRLSRNWSQQKLASQLQLSQARLSEVERGQGSLSAEQLLKVLRLFNVGLEAFADNDTSAEAALQNALATLGAHHLVEDPSALVSERLRSAGHAVCETLTAPSPRLVAALAPVLVVHADTLSLQAWYRSLSTLGLERRLAWAVDCTLLALGQVRGEPIDTKWARAHRRAQVVLDTFAAFARTQAPAKSAMVEDVLDTAIRSVETLRVVRAAGSTPSKRWKVVTTLQPADFADALRDARASG